MNPWDRLPGEGTKEYSWFLEWCQVEPMVDSGDWWRSTLSKRRIPNRPEDAQAFAEIVMRRSWLARQDAFWTRRLTAKALLASRELERLEAGARALEWSARSMAVAVGKLEAWERAPGAVDDRLALALAAEHRQRQRDSGEISRKVEAVVVPAPSHDWSLATDEELDTLAAIEARIAARSGPPKGS